MIKTIRLDMDYECVQNGYRRAVLYEGLVSPKALISAIHARTYNQLDWIDEFGFRDDGWKLVDTSGGSYVGYSYDLEKDGNVVLSTVSKCISNKPFCFTMGFRKENVDGLILGEVRIEIGNYPIAEQVIAEYALYVGGKFKNAVRKFNLEIRDGSYIATTKRDFDFFTAHLSSLRRGDSPNNGIPLCYFNNIFNTVSVVSAQIKDELI